MATDHARIAPSSLHRTVECNGWIQLAETLPPEPESAEAAEGTAGHEVALSWVDGLPMALGAIVGCNGLKVTAEMIEGAELWAATVPEGAICEQKLPRIGRIHPTDCYGTPDAWLYYPKQKLLWLGDYKFGHRYVEVWFNWQFIAYVAGILELLGLHDTDVTVCCEVVQPRYYGANPVREWRFNAADIRAYINIAMQAAKRALEPNPPTAAGPQCLDCPAASVCATLQEAGAAVVSFAGTMRAAHLSPAALALELMLLDRIGDMVRARQTGLEETAKAMLRNGAIIPGVHLERGEGRRKWNDTVPVEEIAMMGQLLGKNLLQPPELITPTQTIKKGIAESIVNEYSHRPPGATKLTLDPDNLQAMKAFRSNQV